MQIEQRYVLVPVEPTEAMIAAGQKVAREADEYEMSCADWFVADHYRAMIAARPADSDMVERGNAMADAITALLNSICGEPVGAGDGNTYVVRHPSAASCNAANKAKNEWRAAIAAMGSADMGKGGEG